MTKALFSLKGYAKWALILFNIIPAGRIPSN
jgi:cytochrome c oxidase subunit IV